MDGGALHSWRNHQDGMMAVAPRLEDPPSGTEAKLTVLSNWKTKSIRRLWTSTALPAQTPGCPHSPCHRSTGDCPQNPVSTSRLVLKIVSTGYTS